MRTRRPPNWRCLRCGRSFYAWKLADCPSCRPDRDDNASALAQILRERRLARREEPIVTREVIRE